LLAYQCYTGFKRFRVGPAGIGAGTAIHPFDANAHLGRGELDYHNGKFGYLATNPDFPQDFKNKVFLADFDPVAGTLRNAVDLVYGGTRDVYCFEFSPDASKAYLTDWHNRDIFGNMSSPNLFRYDFATGNIASWTIPYNTTNCGNPEEEGLGQIELGQDGKLYIPHVNGCQITVVENPDAVAPAFSVIDVNAILSTGVSDHIQSEVLEQPLRLQASPPGVCPGEAITLTASGAAATTPGNWCRGWYHRRATRWKYARRPPLPTPFTPPRPTASAIRRG
jgi:hypothetical protein